MNSNGERKKPKWQRCRIVRADDLRSCMGKAAWANLDSIETCRVDRYRNDRLSSFKISRVIELNVIHATTGSPLAPDMEVIELLARDENDFADEVEMVSFEDWLKGGEKP